MANVAAVRTAEEDVHPAAVNNSTFIARPQQFG